ncbi:MAG TPA: RHS repeat-associated core domain-containing protein [Blastocatellia bacterium]|nr:RHS repeat-associated core domain-containing protein [Blastocatellia bacterium]
MYGEDRPSGTGNPPNDQEKFATYTRDSATGLDYARNRYYNSVSGSFMTADPYKNSAGPKDPGSWSRYIYVTSDPLNLVDPSGLCGEPDTAVWGGSEVTVTGTSPCTASTTPFPLYPLPQGAQTIGDYDDLHGLPLPPMQVLKESITEAIANLRYLPGCASLFGSATALGTLTLTPLDVLKELSNSFRLTSNPSFPFEAVTDFQPTDVLGVRVSWSASITVNQALVNDPQELMLTIIHEAGHVMRALGFQGGQFNDNDGPGQPGNQAANDDLISQKCL